MSRRAPADTERDLQSVGATQPVASRAPRHPGRFGVIAAFAVVVALATSFAVVSAMSHRSPDTRALSAHPAAPALTPTTVASSAPTSTAAPAVSDASRPAAGCPAPPAGSAGRPLLYWARPLTTSRAQTFVSGSLCGIGFHPGERVTLTISPAVGSGISPASGTVIADANGSFVFEYAAGVNASCPGGSEGRVITATGDHGSTATIMVPGGGPDLGIACYAP